jgi:hypothetical protein
MKREYTPLSQYSPIPFQRFQPDIFMTGFSWGHLTDVNMTNFRLRIMNSPFLSNIQQDLLLVNGNSEGKGKGKDLIKIFQTNSYSNLYSLESFRRRNFVLKEIFVNQLGFEELDEYQITAAKLDSQDRIHYAGVPRVMSVIISLNLMCNID